MAARKSRPVRTLVAVGAIIFAMLAALVIGSQVSSASLVPKLALDLEGGTQLILTPKTTDGTEVAEEDINQAIEIIRQRVDASGVAEAEITRQGQQNIVVALPGTPDPATLDLVRQSAQLRFRPVLFIGAPAAIDPNAATGDTEADATASPTPAAPATPEEIEAAALAAADANGDGVLATEPTAEPADNSDQLWFTEQLAFDFFMLDCTDPANLTGGAGSDPAKGSIACDYEGTAKYVLGPADVEGTQVVQAGSGLKTNAAGSVTNTWIVTMEFDDAGTEAFAEATTRLAGLASPQNQFAIVLDDLVVSAPSVSAVIPNGQASIEGSFDQQSAATLANQLNFGSLPLNFEVQSEQQISATLGTEQLQRGLLAGALGLVLVIIYMMFQYRALAGVTLASLSIAALLTYLAITLLSWTAGYRLSLPGVAGLIVAIGITADSFIVYFERIRDEVREGRALKDAVEFGWVRARRTILASDAVNFLAAAVLYTLSVGGVRGFAFTLGLTTVVDLIVVMAFTHPMMQVLIRTRFFGEGHRWSGLDPEHLGASQATYRGRGRISRPTAARPVGTDTAAEPGRMTIAERKAQAARQQEDAGAREDAGTHEQVEATEVKN